MTAPSLASSTDADLVARAAAGDRAAFTQLYERHLDTVHDHVTRWCRDRALAADATQEAFVALLDRLDTIRDGQAVLAWLLRTARNRATDHLRRTSRERATTPLGDGGVPSALLTAVDDDRAASPERAAEATDAASWLWEVASGLDERTFSVLDLTVRHGLSGPELAAVLETTTGNANVLVHRMRTRVRTLFGAVAFLRAPGDCPEMAAIERSLDDPVDLAGARRVEAHAEGCEECDRRRRRAVAPLRAYAALADVAAPPAVRRAIEDAADRHFGTSGPSSPRRARRTVARVLAVVAVAAAVTAVAAPTSEPPPVVTSIPAPVEVAGQRDAAALAPRAVPERRPVPSPPGDDPTPSPSEATTPSAPTDPAAPLPDPPDGDGDPAATDDPPPEPVDPAVVVAIQRPTAGEVVQGAAGQPVVVAVAAVLTGAPVDATTVAWQRDGAGAVLLADLEGLVQLPAPAPCVPDVHTLSVTATAPDGRAARDTVDVVVEPDCPPLSVRITRPADGTVVTATDTRTPGAPAADVAVAGVAAGDDGAIEYVWTSDRAAGTLLTGPSGSIRLTADGCDATTHVLTLTATRPDTGATGQARAAVTVSALC